ncbi:MAG TPA: hypothetical protein VII13_04750 [Vicinamibacteria bacterium]
MTTIEVVAAIILLGAGLAVLRLVSWIDAAYPPARRNVEPFPVRGERKLDRAA